MMVDPYDLPIFLLNMHVDNIYSPSYAIALKRRDYSMKYCRSSPQTQCPVQNTWDSYIYQKNGHWARECPCPKTNQQIAS